MTDNLSPDVAAVQSIVPALLATDTDGTYCDLAGYDECAFITNLFG